MSAFDAAAGAAVPSEAGCGRAGAFRHFPRTVECHVSVETRKAAAAVGHLERREVDEISTYSIL